MIRSAGIALGIAIGLSATAPAGIALAADPSGASTRPWENASAVLRATEQDLQKGGIRAVGPHAADLEAALASAKLTAVGSADGKDVVYVLTDSPAEALIAMAMAATDKSQPRREVVALTNPYPISSLYLGSYYNEIGRSADALRVLDEGLALDGVNGVQLGRFQPKLVGERGAALTALKRWPDSLANYDSGLQIVDLSPADHALLLRGKGFALTELGRLDEAEKAYRDSLTYAPGNAHAQSELAYIAGLRAGKPAAATGLYLPNETQPH